MLSEKFNPEVDQEKRRKVFYKFNEEILNLLDSSDNPEYLGEGFDKLFLKLLRLIKYSNDRNQESKSELSQDTNNLLKKFINFLKNDTKNRAIQGKILNEQKYFFCDIRELLKTLQNGYFFTKIHNSIGPTSLEEYKDKTLGEQMMHNMYGRERGLNKSCEGGSCSYWTVLLYNFFKKLKEAGLDVDIKIYRFKNLEDEIVGERSLRHSGLIVSFQGMDYMVDYNGSLYEEDGEMAKSINRYINEYEDEPDSKNFLNNLKKGKQKETDQIIFFDNIDDFLNHVNEFPEYKRISLYVKLDDRVFPVKFDYDFNENGVKIGLNDRKKDYILSDNELDRENFIKEFMGRIGIIRDIYGLHYITPHERNDLKKCLDIIEDKLDTDKLYTYYTSEKKWKAELQEGDNDVKLIITPKS